jgi:hypothetical protein
MRTSVLFYTFISVFGVTAAITLFGILEIVYIERTYLNALVGTFLVESCGAVIALFKKTDFSDKHETSTIGSLDRSVQIIDRISGQVLDVATGQQSQPNANASHMLIRRFGGDLAAYERKGVITKGQLDQLPSADRDHIRVYEVSLQRLKGAWDKLYPKRVRPDGSIDPEVEHRLKRLVSQMRTDLVGILDFLDHHGLYLDDHYLQVRDVVAKAGT